MKKALFFLILLICANFNVQTIYAQSNGQCKAITKKGTRCKNDAQGNGYCFYHQTKDPTVKRCEATTKKGTRCKLAALDGSKYCYTHQTKDTKVQKCKAITKKGKRCSKPAKIDGYCKQHYKMRQQGKID